MKHKSTALIHYFSMLSFYPFITLWNENGTEPCSQSMCVGAKPAAQVRNDDLYCMWFCNQAARKRTSVSVLSINGPHLYPPIMLVKENVGFIWHPLSLASFPSSYIKAVFCSWCTNVPVYDLVPFCHDRYCWENGMVWFTSTISLRIGNLFSEGVICAAGAALMGDDSGLFKLTLVVWMLKNTCQKAFGVSCCE